MYSKICWVSSSCPVLSLIYSAVLLLVLRKDLMWHQPAPVTGRWCISYPVNPLWGIVWLRYLIFSDPEFYKMIFRADTVAALETSNFFSLLWVWWVVKKISKSTSEFVHKCKYYSAEHQLLWGNPWLVLIRIITIVLKQHKFGKDAYFFLLSFHGGVFLAWAFGEFGGFLCLISGGYFVILGLFFLLREQSLDALKSLDLSKSWSCLGMSSLSQN